MEGTLFSFPESWQFGSRPTVRKRRVSLSQNDGLLDVESYSTGVPRQCGLFSARSARTKNKA